MIMSKARSPRIIAFAIILRKNSPIWHNHYTFFFMMNRIRLVNLGKYFTDIGIYPVIISATSVNRSFSDCPFWDWSLLKMVS